MHAEVEIVCGEIKNSRKQIILVMNYDDDDYDNEWHYSLDGSKPLLIRFHSLS
jgi:hypothetical protein